MNIDFKIVEEWNGKFSVYKRHWLSWDRPVWRYVGLTDTYEQAILKTGNMSHYILERNPIHKPLGR